MLRYSRVDLHTTQSKSKLHETTSVEMKFTARSGHFTCFGF